MRSTINGLSALALAVCAGTATAATVGVSSWDDAAVQAKERDVPVLLELGTQW